MSRKHKPCQRCAMIDALAEAQRLAAGPPDDLVNCMKCGYTRRVRRIPQFNAPSLRGNDDGCPNCEERRKAGERGVSLQAIRGIGIGVEIARSTMDCTLDELIAYHSGKPTA